MKHIIVAAVGLVTCISAFAQGQVDFRNRVGSSPNFTVNAAIYDTTVGTGALLAGSGYSAQLYFSTTLNGSYSAIPDAAVAFRTAGGAGYYDPGSNITRSIPGVDAGQSVFIQIRAWDNSGGASTYEQAVALGKKVGFSNSIQISQLGGTPSGGGAPVTVPSLVGLTSFAIVAVPEPSTIALAGLGLGGLLLARRKKA